MSTPAQYELKTIDDMVDVFSRLPSDRGELMLSEIAEAVRMAGAQHALLKAIGSGLTVGSLTWIDDDQRQGGATYTTKDGDELASLKFKLHGAPAKAQPSPSTGGE